MPNCRHAMVKFTPEWPAADTCDARCQLRRQRLHRRRRSGHAGRASDRQVRRGHRAITAGRTHRAGRGRERCIEAARAAAAQPAAEGTRRNAGQHHRQRPGSGHLRHVAADACRRRQARMARHRRTAGREACARSDGTSRSTTCAAAPNYGDGGFAANTLQVRHDGQPGTLALRAGAAFVQAMRRKRSKASCDANLDAKTWSIARGNLGLAEALSRRALGVDRRRGAAEEHRRRRTPRRASCAALQPRRHRARRCRRRCARLRASHCPPPSTPTCRWASGEVRVALGNLAALRARTRGTQTGLRVVLGSNRVDEAPPASGLIATGRAAALDAVDWIALAQGDGSDAKQKARWPGAAPHRSARRSPAAARWRVPRARLQVSPRRRAARCRCRARAGRHRRAFPIGRRAHDLRPLRSRVLARAAEAGSAAATARRRRRSASHRSRAASRHLRFDVADLRLNALRWARRRCARVHRRRHALRQLQAQSTAHQHRRRTANGTAWARRRARASACTIHSRISAR